MKERLTMEEYIGDCKYCGRAIHCENGFFNGVVLDEHTYACFDCADEHDQKHDTSSDQKA